MRHTPLMRTSVSLYHRHRFPAEIISHSVWLYYRFALSFRDVEEMLAIRGVTLSYETIREWCLSRELARYLISVRLQFRKGPGRNHAAQGCFKILGSRLRCGRYV